MHVLFYSVYLRGKSLVRFFAVIFIELRAGLTNLQAFYSNVNRFNTARIANKEIFST